MRPTLSDDFAQKSTIFIGRVISKTPPVTQFGTSEFIMEVEEAFKNTSVGAHIKVRAGEQGAMCGIGVVSVGDRRQIWLSESGTTNLCTRTTSDINRDLNELRQLANSAL